MAFGKVSVVSHPHTSSFLFLCLIVAARAILALAKRHSTLGRDWYAAPHYRGGGAFIGKYIIKLNRTFTNTLVTWSSRGHGGTHGGSLRGATTAGFFGSPDVSISPRHVLPGDPGTSTVSPSQLSGQLGLPTNVLRNVCDVRLFPPLILGFFPC